VHAKRDFGVIPLAQAARHSRPTSFSRRQYLVLRLHFGSVANNPFGYTMLPYNPAGDAVYFGRFGIVDGHVLIEGVDAAVVE